MISKVIVAKRYLKNLYSVDELERIRQNVLLTPLQLKIMDLHFINDFPLYKIAMEINLSEATIKRHFKKALIKTFEYLKATKLIP
nr:MAG TPA: ECF sigma factor [Bacteriophage sp.]